MKFYQEFDVNENISKVWKFFEQPVRVAECIPGMEKIDVLDDDTLFARVTQKLGPMSATFELKVHITERVHEERIQFTSTGKAVRGAIGNFRSTSTVSLQSVGSQTHVLVEGEAALAGALGSVGQKIITKQADKITAEFARNLESILTGVPGSSLPPSKVEAAGRRPATRPIEGRVMSVQPSEYWAKVSTVFSGATVIIGLMILFGVHL